MPDDDSPMTKMALIKLVCDSSSDEIIINFSWLRMELPTAAK
jgi:hypothetical protein